MQFTRASGGVVDGVGDRGTYQRMRNGTDELGDMMDELVGETRTVLGELLMVQGEDFEAVPGIERAQSEEDDSDDTVDYSVLQDDGNVWLARGDGWVGQQKVGRADKQGSRADRKRGVTGRWGTGPRRCASTERQWSGSAKQCWC